MAAGAAIGAAAGGSAGAAGGFNETSNNYLTAANLLSRDQKIKRCQANGDTACEVRVKQEYDLKSANNSGELKHSSLIEKQALEQTRAGLEQLLLNPSVSEETKGQARKSISELNTAIKVINKAPVLRDATEVGLLAVDVITLGEFAAARGLTSSVVKQVVFSRTGKELGDEAAARIANNFYRDGLDVPALATSSGNIIQATPGKTTTVLGTYLGDTRSIIDVQLGLPKLPDFVAPKPGGFNLLNVPDATFEQMKNVSPTAFWEQVNRPFLDAAIQRGDDIVLATKPDPLTPFVMYRPDGTLTGFGQEVQYLKSQGYIYESETGKMVRR